MSTLDIERVRQLFTQARQMPKEKRLPWLCAQGDSAEMIREVSELLAHDVSDSFIEQPILESPAGAALAKLVNEELALPKSYPDPTASFSPKEIIEPEGKSLSISPRYRLLQKIGEGGFGMVYMAEQLEPVRRRVAIKVLKPGMDSRSVVARFETERQALAMMDHPNIARILDGGLASDGRPYFVMELVNGIPVTDYCDAHKLDHIERMQLLKKVCYAIQHAHHKGVIHRDLKPSNVLVSRIDGQAVPKVIDFGIAKALFGPLTDKTLFTEFRQMIGTLEYMSPEQAETSVLDADTRSDVYSLGVLAYELLTGTTPLDGEYLRRLAFGEMQRTIREVVPPLPSKRISTLSTINCDHISTNSLQRGAAVADPPLPGKSRSFMRAMAGDLDWIVMKALEKDRHRRYTSAADLAADLDRWLSNSPVEARPPSWTYRTRKFCTKFRRQILVVASLAIAALMATAGVVYGYLQSRESLKRADLANNEAREAQQATDVEVSRVASLTYGNAMVAAHESFLAGRRANTHSILAACPSSQRGIEWNWMTYLASDHSITLLGHRNGPALAVQYSPDGLTLASSGTDGMIRVWDIGKQSEMRSWLAHDGPASKLAFLNDGTRLVSGGQDGAVILWDYRSGQKLYTFSLGESVTAVAIHRDGKLIASGGSNGAVVVWDIQVDDPTVGKRYRVAATSESDTNRSNQSPRNHIGGIQSLYFEDTLPILLSAGKSGVFLWDLLSGNQLKSFGDYWVSYGAIPLGESNQMVIFGPPVTVWDIATEQEICRFDLPATGILCAAAESGSDGIVFATEDNAVRRLDAATGEQTTIAFGDQGTIHGIATSPNSNSFALAGDDGSIRIWHRSHSTQRLSWNQRNEEFCQVVVAQNHRLVGLTVTGKMAIWNQTETNARIENEAHQVQGFSVEAMCNGRQLVSLGLDKRLVVWDVEDGTLEKEFPASLGCKFVRSHPTRNWVVGPMSPDRDRYELPGNSSDSAYSGSNFEQDQIALWDLDLGKIIRVYTGLSNWALGASFSSDGSHLAVASVEGAIFVWDVGSAKLLNRLQRETSVQSNSVVFSIDGKHVIAGYRDGRVVIWELISGQPISQMICHGDEVSAVAISSNGARLLTGSPGDSRLRIWNWRTGERVAEFGSGFEGVSHFDLSDDDSKLAISGSAGGVRILRIGEPTGEQKK